MSSGGDGIWVSNSLQMAISLPSASKTRVKRLLQRGVGLGQRGRQRQEDERRQHDARGDDGVRIPTSPRAVA